MIPRKWLTPETTHEQATATRERSAHDNGSGIQQGSRQEVDSDTFARLYNEKVCAESTDQYQTSWVQQITALEQASRKQVNNAIDRYLGHASRANNAALLHALREADACRKALDEAYRDQRESHAAKARAQAAYTQAICNSPRDSLGTRMANCKIASTAPRKGKRVSWPSDDDLEALRIIPDRHDTEIASLDRAGEDVKYVD